MIKDYSTSSENYSGKSELDPEQDAFKMLDDLRAYTGIKRPKPTTFNKIALAMGVSTTRVFRLAETECNKILATEYFRLKKLHEEKFGGK